MLKPSARIFPLGTVLEGETADYNPNNYYVDGIWERTQKGQVSVGLDESQSEFNLIGKIGGSKYLQNHDHMERTYSNNYNAGKTIPTYRAFAHTFDASRNTGNWGFSSGNIVPNSEINQMIETERTGQGNSENLQPYKVVYKWKLISYSN